MINRVTSYEAIELENNKKERFIVNGHEWSTIMKVLFIKWSNTDDISECILEICLAKDIKSEAYWEVSQYLYYLYFYCFVENKEYRVMAKYLEKFW